MANLLADNELAVPSAAGLVAQLLRRRTDMVRGAVLDPRLDSLRTSNSSKQPEREAAPALLLGVVLAVGLLARGLWAVWHTGAITEEGA
jgi:hypothetical protein